jgi:hypothetical protein
MSDFASSFFFPTMKQKRADFSLFESVLVTGERAGLVVEPPNHDRTTLNKMDIMKESCPNKQHTDEPFSIQPPAIPRCKQDA